MRLDKERQQKLEPQRFEHAKQQLQSFGFQIAVEYGTDLKFIYKGEMITFFPYSGWHTGKSIEDGRGLKNLINQLT